MKHRRLSGLVELSEAAQVTLTLGAVANVSTAVGANMVLLEYGLDEVAAKLRTLGPFLL